MRLGIQNRVLGHDCDIPLPLGQMIVQRKHIAPQIAIGQGSLRGSAPPSSRIAVLAQSTARLPAVKADLRPLSKATATTTSFVEERHKYRSFTRQGNTVCTEVVHTDVGARVDVLLAGPGIENSNGATAPTLHWGMYRASATQWYHPRESVPPGSKLDAGSGGMRTPMVWRAEAAAWQVSITVPAKLLPLHLAMVFFYPGAAVYEVPPRSKFFSVPVGMTAGVPGPAGAMISACKPKNARAQDAVCNVNFALFSRNATAVYLCLVRVQNPSANSATLQGSGILEIVLDPVTNRTGDMWHMCVHGLKNLGLMCYGWRVDGDITWENGGRFHPGFILSDPYSPRSVPVLLPEAAYTGAPKLLPTYNVAQPVMLSSLACFTQSFQWGGAHVPLGRDKRPLARQLEDTVMLELDVLWFTTGPEAERAVPTSRRGKYLGVLDRLQDIVSAGVTAVLLGPVLQSAPGVGPWGSNPISLLSPDDKLATQGPLSAAPELKTVIKALHAAGLEVLLSVEYCITAEGADALSGGLQGMRGVDAAMYYRTLPDRSTVLATGQPIVRQLVLDSLRHLAVEYNVQGFCFVNAEHLTQDRSGEVLDNPPLMEDICLDGTLSGLKLIAAPGNHQLLPRQGIRGVPHWARWMQLNDRFRSDMWSYVVGNTPGCLSAVATRLTGSADLFGPQWDAVPPLPGGLAAGRRAAFGVNSLLGLGDQQLLQALGSEQDLDTAEVLARTLLLALFTSSGTPLVSANTLNRKGLWRFMAVMTALRKQYMDLINPPLSFNPASTSQPARELRWHGAGQGAEVDWQGAAAGAAPSNILAFSLRDSGSRALYTAFNPYNHHVAVALPGPGAAGCWRLVVDTSRMPPEDADLEGPVLPPGQPLFDIAPRAGILLVAVEHGAVSARSAPAAPSASPPPTAQSLPGSAGGLGAARQGPGGTNIVRPYAGERAPTGPGGGAGGRPGSVSPSRGIWMGDRPSSPAQARVVGLAVRLGLPDRGLRMGRAA